MPLLLDFISSIDALFIDIYKFTMIMDSIICNIDLNYDHIDLTKSNLFI